MALLTMRQDFRVPADGSATSRDIYDAAMDQFVWADEQPSFMYARVQQGYTFDSKVQDVRLFEDGTALLDRIWLDR